MKTKIHEKEIHEKKILAHSTVLSQHISIGIVNVQLLCIVSTFVMSTDDWQRLYVQNTSWALGTIYKKHSSKSMFHAPKIIPFSS